MLSLATEHTQTATMAESRGTEMKGLLAFLLVLCVTTVTLRCYTRKYIVKLFAVEDWLAVGSLVRKTMMPLDPGSCPVKIHSKQNRMPLDLALPLTLISTGLVHCLHFIRSPVCTPWARQQAHQRPPQRSAHRIYVAAPLHDYIYRYISPD